MLFRSPNLSVEEFLALDPNDHEKLLSIKAIQYDIVCNGTELSSGAIRNHRPEVMKKATKLTSRIQLEQGNIYTDHELMKLRKVMPIVIAYLEKSKDQGIANKVIDIADEFDHLVHPEERRKAVQPDLALDMIVRGAGERFDDKAVVAFDKLFKRGEVTKVEVAASV